MAVRTLKVTVVGAGGGIGQPLSLLIRRCPGIDELALHDLSDMKGIAADLSHVSQSGKVIAFTGDEELEPALTRADVVVVEPPLYPPYPWPFSSHPCPRMRTPWPAC